MSRAPDPLAMKRGSPPTPLKARTGEFTPPGKSFSARACSRREASFLRTDMAGEGVAPPPARKKRSALLRAELALGVVAEGGQLHLPAVLVAARVPGKLLDGAARDLRVHPPLALASHAAEDHVPGLEGARRDGDGLHSLGGALDALLREPGGRSVVGALVHRHLRAFLVVGELAAHAHESLLAGVEQPFEDGGAVLVIGELHLPPLAALRVVEEVRALDADRLAVVALAAPARVLAGLVLDLGHVVSARGERIGEDHIHVHVEEGRVHRSHAHAAAAVAGGLRALRSAGVADHAGADVAAGLITGAGKGRVDHAAGSRSGQHREAEVLHVGVLPPKTGERRYPAPTPAPSRHTQGAAQS